MGSRSYLVYFFLAATAVSAARHSFKFRNGTIDDNETAVKAACRPSGTLHASRGIKDCSECCKKGKRYFQYKCSPPIKKMTPATLTVNDFDKGGDGGAPSECDGKFHRATEHVVALSTGWFAQKGRCGKTITIYGNGRSVTAKVVDECDSVNGCDGDHGYQPPCPNNVVDASSSVWRALGISEHDSRYGGMPITWSL